MTNRRPQDPRTKKVRDEQRDIETMGDAGATMMPGEGDDPNATVMPDALEPPKPKGGVRGGAAQQWGGSGIMAPPDRTVTADNIGVTRDEVLKQMVAGKKRKKGAGPVVWILAFLLLGEIGFGVAWFVMNPPGGSGGGEPVATSGGEDAATKAEDAAAQEEVAAADSAVAAAETTAVDAAAETVADAVAAAETTPGDVAGETVADAVAAAETTADVAGEAVADTAMAAAETTADVTGETVADTAVPAAETTLADTTAPADAATAEVVAMGTAPGAPDAAVAETTPAPPAHNPAEATRLNNEGLALRKSGDHAGALKAYEQAVALDDGSVWAHYNYACELAVAGRSKEALAELTKLYKLGTADSRKALGAARRDSDFDSIKNTGQFFRLTNF